MQLCDSLFCFFHFMWTIDGHDFVYLRRPELEFGRLLCSEGKITCLSCVNKSVFGPSRAYARARALQNYTFCFHNLHTFPFNTL